MDAVAAKAGSPAMDKQQFLKLFTSQLKYQDPLNPMDSSQFTSQLAQLTSVEQMMNMNKGIEKLVTMQDNMQRTASTGLIGNLVKLNDGSEGRVMGIRFDEGGPFMLLSNNLQVTMADIKETYKPGFLPEAPKTDVMANGFVGTQPLPNNIPDVNGLEPKASDFQSANTNNIPKVDDIAPKVSDFQATNTNNLPKVDDIAPKVSDFQATNSIPNVNDTAPKVSDFQSDKKDAKLDTSNKQLANKQVSPQAKVDWRSMNDIGRTNVVARGTSSDSKNPDANKNEYSERIENIARIE